ncbi:MAG: F-box protein [Alphaproteobacteria bacterium]|nr:F-box protein [Alphaproteobacteria bacterium]
MSAQDLARVAQVNKNLNAHANDDLLWKEKVTQAVGPIKKDPRDTWKQVYQRIDALTTLRKAFESYFRDPNAYLDIGLPKGTRVSMMDVVATMKGSKTGEDVYTLIHSFKRLSPMKKTTSISFWAPYTALPPLFHIRLSIKSLIN